MMMTPGVTPHEYNEGFDEAFRRDSQGAPRTVIPSYGAWGSRCQKPPFTLCHRLMKWALSRTSPQTAQQAYTTLSSRISAASEDVPAAIETAHSECEKEPRGLHQRGAKLWNAYKLDIPATYHIALGTDIIHQHPTCDMELSRANHARALISKKMAYSVSQLDGGVFLNFGSAVIGPEVFLKTLSIARNLGYPTFNITTANFDLVRLGNFRCKIGYEDPNYYYRPRKNIVNRPTCRGGMGWHFEGDHQITIPTLYDKLKEQL